MPAWRELTHAAFHHPIWYRARYGLFARRREEADFFATPELYDRTDPARVPAVFADFVGGVEGRGSFERACEIARRLRQGRRAGGALGRDAIGALRGIVEEERGVCSDYAQVFVGLCAAASIPCREWGVSLDGMRGGSGHSFCEVWHDEFARWVIVDPLLLLSWQRVEDGAPVGVVELTAGASVCAASLGEPDFATPVIELYYRDPKGVYFLLTNNDVFVGQTIERRLDRLPVPLRQGILAALGYHPRYVVLASGGRSTPM